MTMGTERSSSSSSLASPKALHNFTMPGGLRWGNQKFLRCMKVNADGQISAVERKPPSSYSSSYSYAAAAGGGGSRAYVDNEFIRRKTEMGGGGSRADVYSEMIRRQTEKGGSGRSDEHLYCFNDINKKREMGLLFRPPLPPEKRLRVVDGGGEDDDGIGIAEVREKVILDLRTAADKMKDAILRREGFGDDTGETPAPSPAEEGVRPWNLRTRRAAFSLAAGGSGGAACGGGEKNLKVDVIKPNFNASTTSPLRVAGETTPRLRSGGAVVAAAAPSGEKKERAKFSVPLTRREIEEDFMAMVGHRPLRRPKKRPKYIQKTLDTLFPGLWLTEITADIYKVPETQ